ncbi:phosphatidylserine decarboxylase [Sphingomonas arantia]|uniref:Phosphatidylserine decarboxylase proenzyme n=1 Tax=Sphingomonas arantia TaxID=1460676 RepID=A0ABW4TV35_9SPHN
MTSLEKPDVGTTTIKWRFPSVHPDGRKFVLISAAITVLLLFFIWDELGFVFIGITMWVAAFFRDPIRTAPRGEGLIIAPADGLITMIATVAPPRELEGPDGLGSLPMTRVSIFMSVFDVHINRSPIAGTIRRVVYISGAFLNADLDKASEDNERQHIMVEGTDGTRIGFTQIAGLVARRIVPFVKPGDLVAQAQRIGLIRFGSRVDVYLPAGTLPRVALGQRTLAGETVLAKIGESIAVTGIAQ